MGGDGVAPKLHHLQALHSQAYHSQANQGHALQNLERTQFCAEGACAVAPQRELKEHALVDPKMR